MRKRVHKNYTIMEGMKISVDKFDGKDFAFWKMQITDYLYQRNMHLPLEGKMPTTMGKAEWEHLDRQALGVVRLTLARNVAFNVMGATTTFDLMETLGSMYEKPSAANKVFLMRRLFNLEMHDGTTMADHINEFNVITRQLNSVKINFDDEIKALLLLSSLPSSWDTTVTAISSSKGQDKLKFEEVRDLILSESLRKGESGETSKEISAGLFASGRGRKSGKGSYHVRSKSRGRGGPVCWDCGESGHIKRDCPNPKKNRQQRNDDGEADFAIEQEGELLAVSAENKVESWVLDSGVSFHASPDRKLFHKFISDRRGTAYLANGKPVAIMGKGDVKIQTPSGGRWELTDVMFILTLKKKLISRGKT